MLTVLSLGRDHGARPRGDGPGHHFVVTTIPGGGWIHSIDNTAGGSTQLVPFAGPGRWETALSSSPWRRTRTLAGVAHPFLPAGIPFSDLTAGGWRTFVTGDGHPGTEAPH